MSDNGTLRDHLADVINERNDLLRQVEHLLRQLEQLKQLIDEVNNQYGALWKVSDPE